MPNRQRITLPNALDKEKKPLPLTDDKKTLADYGVGEDGALRLKDLGFQVGYRWLYIWEYVSAGLQVETLTAGRTDHHQPSHAPAVSEGLWPLRSLYFAIVSWCERVPS